MGELLVGDGDVGLHRRLVGSGAHAEGRLQDRAAPPAGPVRHQLGEGSKSDVLVVGDLVHVWNHGQRAASRVQDHVGDGALAADADLPRIVPATFYIVNRNSDN